MVDRRQPRVAVLGGGSWGTTVASIVARSAPTVLWARSPEVAEEVDRRLEKPTASTSQGARSYARAIEKGSNDRARSVDRHEVLIKLLSVHLGEKK